MALSDTHPEYADFLPDWQLLRDAYRGERRVKAKGRLYLPATQRMVLDGLDQPEQKGSIAYNAYKTRARFPEVVSDAIEALIGIMHRKPPSIELPAALEYMRERATARNESLELLLRRINEQQLALGRVGLLADVIDRGERDGEFYLTTYDAEHGRNWDEGRRTSLEVHNLNLVVLDESGPVRTTDLSWEQRERYRVLALTSVLNPIEGDGDTSTEGRARAALVPQGEGIYVAAVFEDEDPTLRAGDGKFVEISSRGRTINKIPFVFINSKDIAAEPDDPPLLGAAQLAMAIYRGEADYRQALFMQGQDTLVVIGGSEESYPTGAGACINLDGGANNDAKFIGVDSSGLAEMRSALENDYKHAAMKGGQLLDQTGGGQESGEALRIRVAARTTTVNQIALAGAAGLQHVLRICAEWVGANPDEVVVTPNMEFADDTITGRELGELMGAKSLGLPVSMETVHAIMAKRGVTEMTFDEEKAKIVEERDEEAFNDGGDTDSDDIGVDDAPIDPNDEPVVEPEADPNDDPDE